MSKRHIFILVLLLAAAAPACGNDNTGRVVSTSDSGQNAASTAPPPLSFKVGDVVQLENHAITLNSATVDSANILKANFTIENQGDEELNISSSLFEARDDTGTSSDRENSDCGPGLDDSVLPGDKLRGDICWSVDEEVSIGWTLHYEVEFFDRGQVVWDVRK